MGWNPLRPLGNFVGSTLKKVGVSDGLANAMNQFTGIESYTARQNSRAIGGRLGHNLEVEAERNLAHPERHVGRSAATAALIYGGMGAADGMFEPAASTANSAVSAGDMAALKGANAAWAPGAASGAVGGGTAALDASQVGAMNPGSTGPGSLGGADLVGTPQASSVTGSLPNMPTLDPAIAPAAGSSPWATAGNFIARNPLQTAALVSTLTGGGGGGSAPVLDPGPAAKAQGDANREASLFDTYLNRPDQVTPQGSLKWTLKPGADPKNPQPGDWVQTTSLNETGQQLYDADQALQLGMTGTSQAALGRVNDTLGQALDTSGLPEMGQVSNFTGADRQRIEDALMARLQPGFAQDEEAMRSRTLNTGFELGSEGSQREQFRLDKAKNDARLAAIAQSGQEAERLGNISRADASFQNQSRQQGLQEILAERALPLNELNALRSGSQVRQPTFSPVSQSNTASAPVLDALMAQLSGQQANAANKQSGYNALLASLAQLGGSIWGD